MSPIPPAPPSRDKLSSTNLGARPCGSDDRQYFKSSFPILISLSHIWAEGYTKATVSQCSLGCRVHLSFQSIIAATVPSLMCHVPICHLSPHPDVSLSLQSPWKLEDDLSPFSSRPPGCQLPPLPGDCHWSPEDRSWSPENHQWSSWWQACPGGLSRRPRDWCRNRCRASPRFLTTRTLGTSTWWWPGLRGVPSREGSSSWSCSCRRTIPWQLLRYGGGRT